MNQSACITMEASILVVDDERNVRLMYRAALDSMFKVDEAESARQGARDASRRTATTSRILDLRMPEMTGLELLEQMNQRGITTPVVFITAYADVPNAVSAMKFGAIDFLQKPITPDQLRAIVKDVLVRHSVEDRKTPEPHDFDYYPPLREARDQPARLCRRPRAT